MRIKNLLIRFLFCLPFIATVLYVHSYHGELINNTEVHWQYVQNDEGKVYLALDVYAPSGIKIDGIFSNNREITDCWQLINYPDWYKGKENFDKFSEFQEVLHPYLPYNDDFNVLYTTGWYTFLYEWDCKLFGAIPPETSIRIKYQNIGTQNHYYAKRTSGAKLVSKIGKSNIDGPVIDVQVLYPFSSSHSDENKFKISLSNLVPDVDSSGYVLEDLGRNDYGISIQDEKGSIIDSLRGFVKLDREGACQVYYKTRGVNEYQTSLVNIDFRELLRHIAAIIFMVYFVLICRYIGLLFVKWRGIVLDSYAAKLIIPIFLGITFLTYLFFAIGIFKLLYFPLLFVILLIILFFGFNPEADLSNLRTALINQLNKIKEAPWEIVFFVLLLAMLFYNFSFCFIPSTVLDGSTDVTSNYLPLLDYYVKEHSFKSPIQNSYVGLLPQSGDVLRTVVKMFTGEPGVLLLSFTFLLGILGSIYLICKKIFKIKNMLIYLSLILFLSSNIFTEVIHFGKVGTIILSFYLITLYSLRYSEHEKNYILIPLFFAFITSQYAFFAAPALVFYFFAIKIRRQNRLYKKGLVFFLILSSIFYIKLIIENGVCFPPGMIPEQLADFFLKFNQNNEFYKYIDNNYIRFFQKPQSGILTSIAEIDDKIRNMLFKLSTKTVFDWTLGLLPFILISKAVKYKKVYLLMSVFTLFYFFVIINNPRTFVYYLFVILILQVIIIDKVLLFIKLYLKKGHYISVITIMIFLLLFDVKAMAIRNKGYWFTNLRGTAKGIRYESWKKYILPVFCCYRSKYQYLYNSATEQSELCKVPYYAGYLHENEGLCQKSFDHAMLIRNYTNTKDVILIIPELFHGYTGRTTTARGALGSVVHQKDVDAIMSDLKKLNINYLSVITADSRVIYNTVYTPIFEEDTFYKYFKLLFSNNGARFYEIIHDGTNTEYTPSPCDMEGRPFVPMMKAEKT